jgi:hypothetical protein
MRLKETEPRDGHGLLPSELPLPLSFFPFDATLVVDIGQRLDLLKHARQLLLDLAANSVIPSVTTAAIVVVGQRDSQTVVSIFDGHPVGVAIHGDHQLTPPHVSWDGHLIAAPFGLRGKCLHDPESSRQVLRSSPRGRWAVRGTHPQLSGTLSGGLAASFSSRTASWILGPSRVGTDTSMSEPTVAPSLRGSCAHSLPREAARRTIALRSGGNDEFTRRTLPGESRRRGKQQCASH